MRLVLSTIPVGLLLACRADSVEGTAPPSSDSATDPTTTPTGDTAPSEPPEPLWTADADTPTFVTVTFPPRPGIARLTWSDDAGEHELETDGESGRFRLLGLPAGSEVSWTLAVGEQTSGPHLASVAPPPVALDGWTVLHHETSSELTDRWLLGTQFSFQGRSFAVVLDAEGRVRWWRQAPPQHRILRIQPTDDGAGLYWISNVASHLRDEGVIVREPFDGEDVTTTAPRLHHDAVQHGDGYAFLAHEDRDVDVDGDAKPDPMSSDVIRIVEEGGTGAYTDVFSFFDSWPAEPSTPCRHAVLGGFLPDRIEWTHSNSLVRDPGGDGWWVLPRFLDQIGRVRADGELTSVLGGTDPTLTFAGEGLPFEHGHMSQVTNDGTLLVFSNGNHTHRAEGSHVVELLVDEGAGTVDEVWRTPEPHGHFIGFLGDARRLPGGHTLVVSPGYGMAEVTADGTVVWEAAAPRSAEELGRFEVVEPWVHTW